MTCISRGSPATLTWRMKLPLWLPRTRSPHHLGVHNERGSKRIYATNKTRQRTQPVEVLIDSGAGGGNYASCSFMFSTTRGGGRLRAANPSDSGVAPMTIRGTCVLFLVFPSIDGTFGVRVRVVEGLPVGLILGTAFMRRYHSTLDFGGVGAGWFRPSPTSDRTPLLPWLEPQRMNTKTPRGRDMRPEEEDRPRQAF